MDEKWKRHSSVIKNQSTSLGAKNINAQYLLLKEQEQNQLIVGMKTKKNSRSPMDSV